MPNALGNMTLHYLPCHTDGGRSQLLDATRHLYKRLCTSVVGWSVRLFSSYRGVSRLVPVSRLFTSGPGSPWLTVSCLLSDTAHRNRALNYSKSVAGRSGKNQISVTLALAFDRPLPFPGKTTSSAESQGRTNV